MNRNATSAVKDDITESISAMLLFNSSCQAIVETYVAPPPSTTDWYNKISTELDNVQKMIREWRLSGNLYCNTDIISQIITCASFMDSVNGNIEQLFNELKNQYSDTLKNNLVDFLQKISDQINTVYQTVNSYYIDLTNWKNKVEQSKQDINDTINAIQAEEKEIQSEIISINKNIEDLQKQIQNEREAIAKAKDQEKAGIFETVFGIIFAPFTGGTSLILAGFGVASIAEAEAQVSALEDSLKHYQDLIAQDQKNLDDDKKQISSLKLILASVATLIDDCSYIDSSVITLQITLATLRKEISDVVTKISNATNSEMIIGQKFWYEDTYNQWQSIQKLANTLQTTTPVTQKINIG